MIKGRIYRYVVSTDTTIKYYCDDFIMFIQNPIFNHYDIIMMQIREALHTLHFCFTIE